MIDTMRGTAAHAAGRRGTVVLVILFLLYLAALGGWGGRGRPAFDPLAARPHAIEQLIVAGRYAEALPQVAALRERYPAVWLVAMWLARAHHGLGHWREEADAWEEFARLSPAPQESCPALPQAYERLASERRALAAYERCAAFDPFDPGPLADLGAAYARAGRNDEALAVYRRAAALDDDPDIERRIAALAEHQRAAQAVALRQP